MVHFVAKVKKYKLLRKNYKDFFMICHYSRKWENIFKFSEMFFFIAKLSSKDTLYG